MGHSSETTSPRPVGRNVPELPIVLDRAAAASLTSQLAGQLRETMRAGVLSVGERLPSTRALARQLSVSRTVVTEAFQQLYAEGWLEGRHGSGTRVADLPDYAHAAPAPRSPRRRPLSAERPAPLGASAGEMVDLRPGAPWVKGYDEVAWRRAWRLAGEVAPTDRPDPYGMPRLREALAAHLRRTRAVPAAMGDVMVTSGTGNGLDLVAATLLRPGDRVGVEEPGYRTARHIFAARGAEIVPCPVDADGVIVEELPDDLVLLYTTPAHQYPVGGRLPISRRERLLAWARRTGAIVIEDDYDAEFRYDVTPLPALYGLDPAGVVLLGTLSKSLAPDVGVGWVLAAPELLDGLAATRKRLADKTPGPVQAAVAVLLERGDLARHLRRMRLEYARRRAVIVDILGDRVRGDTAGLHVLVELPAAAVRPLVAAAWERGVMLDSTERHHHGPLRVHGLVLGYGSATVNEVRKGCEVVAKLLADR
ncbi:MocR-like pyridoxine biosynthesis transcription factor PdxR [Streptosporangium soli]|nr:PLP-dependent aminotransferase family protein [Streptosporangium sp. KLBMP 9127]